MHHQISTTDTGVHNTSRKKKLSIVWVPERVGVALMTVWKNKGRQKKTMKTIYIATVVPIAINDSETWWMNALELRSVEAADTRHLRSMYGITNYGTVRTDTM